MQYLHQFLNEGSYFPNYKTTATRDIPLRDGSTIPSGTEVMIDFNTEHDATMFVRHAGKNLKMPIEVAFRYFSGFQRPPKNIQLQKELEQHDGKCSTPIGGLVNPNGYGSFGEPSWMLVLDKVQ